MYSLGVILFQLVFPCNTDSELCTALDKVLDAMKHGNKKAAFDALPQSVHLLPRKEVRLWVGGCPTCLLSVYATKHIRLPMLPGVVEKD